MHSARNVTHIPQHTWRHIPDDHKLHINLLRNLVLHIFVLASFDSEIQDEIAGRVARTEETKNAYILLVGNFKIPIHTVDI